MTGIFFHYFALHEGKTITARTYALTCLHPLVAIYRRPCRSNWPWPFKLITKCETVRVRINSTSFNLVVTFSSRNQIFLDSSWKSTRNYNQAACGSCSDACDGCRRCSLCKDRFMADKNFVLCAMYIWDTGKVTRYPLFPDSYNPEVYWTLFITNLGG